MLIANYPRSAKSDATPNLRICVLYDLPATEGIMRHLVPSTRVVGDLAIVVKEAIPLQLDAETGFEHLRTIFLLAKGSTPVRQLPIGKAAISILRAATTYLLSIYAAPLTILAETLWDVLEPDPRQRVSFGGEFSLPLFKWWTFVRWQTRSGSVLVDLDMHLFTEHEFKGTARKKALYEITATAKIGRARSPLAIGAVGAKVLGDSELSGSYSTRWRQ